MPKSESTSSSSRALPRMTVCDSSGRGFCTLGRFSMARWFPGERISRIHGQPKQVGRRLVVPMYHPAAALHQGALRGAIEEDFAKLPKFLAEVERMRASAAAQEAPKPQQGSLF